MCGGGGVMGSSRMNPSPSVPPPFVQSTIQSPRIHTITDQLSYQRKTRPTKRQPPGGVLRPQGPVAAGVHRGGAPQDGPHRLRHGHSACIDCMFRFGWVCVRTCMCTRPSCTHSTNPCIIHPSTHTNTHRSQWACNSEPSN